MTTTPHKAIYAQGTTDKAWLINKILDGNFFGQDLDIGSFKKAVYSSSELAHFIDEEIRHGHLEVDTGLNTTLANASSGEQRKALLAHILSRKPGLLIVENVFENLDQAAKATITRELENIAQTVVLIQILNRRSDLLSFIPLVYIPEDADKIQVTDREFFLQSEPANANTGDVTVIPGPLHPYLLPDYPLVKLNKVSVQYEGRPILKDITWNINPGEFWHLRGPNGSGKSTLLSMITGDNPKAYGQDMVLFGLQKGSGETVWEIKENIGYFAPNMTRYFERQDTVEQMIISGFFDSVGLYIKPSDMQVKLADDWLKVLGMPEDKNKPFRLLPEGLQRMIMIARAMVKHPPLLILDEPAGGLDDNSALLFTALINRVSAETRTAILYVSHRPEPGLIPAHIFELIPGPTGSSGLITC